MAGLMRRLQPSDDPDRDARVLGPFAMLLVHGMGKNAHHDWQLTIPALLDNYRVITLDLPPDLSADVRATTVNGEISTDFPMTIIGRVSHRHVAGTIGAVGNNGLGVTGVAWHVKLMSLKFLGAVPGTTSNAIKCIKYAVAQKKAGINVRVINASWGLDSFSESLSNAMADLRDAGIIVAAAAGSLGVEVERAH